MFRDSIGIHLVAHHPTVVLPLFSSRSHHQWFSRPCVCRRLFSCSVASTAHMNRCPLSTTVNSQNSSSSLVPPIDAVSRRFRGQSRDPPYIFGHSQAPTSRSFLPTCCTPFAISQSWFCNPLLSTLLKSSRMFFTAPRLPIRVRWNRWLSGYTSVTAACRSVSWQCCTLDTHEMNFDLDFSMLPWHSMAAG